MRVIKEQPPNIDALRQIFPIQKGTIFTYGHIIYNPDGIEITPELKAHEEVHMRQQISSPSIEAWWEMYMTVEWWRFEQELAAHIAEYAIASQRAPNRKVRQGKLNVIAGRLASPLYGCRVKKAQAKKLIKKGVVRINSAKQ